ncbi:uncharacterized protein [Populus alba]|uniref:uncharacterized protein isoform X1 n=1 Tax=Populus alba TaxID=43335 RepID=UPI001588BCEC|nr:uncharacterized protein LOC118037651 isoform X1 [Populus alba]
MMCVRSFVAQRSKTGLTEYFMDFKRVYEEPNSLLPFSTDVKTQQSQCEQIAVMSFLAGLPSEFDAARTQILSSSEITTLHDNFTRILRSEGSRSAPLITSTLVSRGTLNEVGRGSRDSRGNRKNTGFQGSWSSGGLGRNAGHNKPVCYYCDELGHTRRTCWKLHGKPQQQAQVANIATQGINLVSTVSSSNDKFVLVSADEFSHFTQYQASLKSNPSTIDELGKPTTCLVSSSSKWVIDSGATNHMTGKKGSYDGEDYW